MIQITQKTYNLETRTFGTATFDIAPCPFCGVDGEQCLDDMIACRSDQLDEEHARGRLAVWCGNCGAVGPQRDTAAEAVVAWNLRTTAAPG